MYKSISSFLLPWFSRKRGTDQPLQPHEVPTSFNMPVQKREGTKLINVSMSELDDAFVDIRTRQLLYAEAALVRPEGPQNPRVIPAVVPLVVSGKRVEAPRVAVGDDDELEQSMIVEKLKSDAAYKKKQKNKKRRR